MTYDQRVFDICVCVLYLYAQSLVKTLKHKPVKLEMVLRSPTTVFCRYTEALEVLASSHEGKDYPLLLPS